MSSTPPRPAPRSRLRPGALRSRPRPGSSPVSPPEGRRGGVPGEGPPAPAPRLPTENQGSRGGLPETRVFNRSVFPGVTHDVVLEESLLVGIEGALTGSTYHRLSCRSCKLGLGFHLYSSSAALASWRGLFCLAKDKIVCYLLETKCTVEASEMTFPTVDIGENIEKVKFLNDVLPPPCVCSPAAKRLRNGGRAGGGPADFHPGPRMLCVTTTGKNKPSGPEGVAPEKFQPGKNLGGTPVGVGIDGLYISRSFIEPFLDAEHRTRRWGEHDITDPFPAHLGLRSQVLWGQGTRLPICQSRHPSSVVFIERPPCAEHCTEGLGEDNRVGRPRPLPKTV
uniref:Mis18 domain-containing protein n=1 Tax=Ornithorhynchus anatinus TaxID=9258 RepID=A0A6I8N3H5_ORNAN